MIAARGLYDRPGAELPERETHDGVTIHRVVRPRFGRGGLAGRAIDYLAMYWGFAAALAKLARRGDIVVVKTDPPLLSCAVAPIVRTKGLIQVNWLQDLYPEVALGLGMTALKPVAPLLVAARDASLRGAHNVAIGETMARRLQTHRVVSDEISTIPNWSDDTPVRPIPRAQNPLRTEWGFGDKFVVGYSGNLGRAHEFATLLDAAERLRGEPDLVFLFIGGGHGIESLKREVEQRGLGAMFAFRPYQPASMLSQSLTLPDVHWISLRPEMEGLIVPSKFYGVAAAGRPTIAVSASDGEIGALVVRHDCGVSVAPGDGAALAAAILALKGDPDACQRMGRNARILLETRFTRDAAFALWDSLLGKIDAERAVAPSAG